MSHTRFWLLWACVPGCFIGAFAAAIQGWYSLAFVEAGIFAYALWQLRKYESFHDKL